MYKISKFKIGDLAWTKVSCTLKLASTKQNILYLFQIVSLSEKNQHFLMLVLISVRYHLPQDFYF